MIERFVRPAVARLTPYVSARSLSDKEGTGFLDANESPVSGLSAEGRRERASLNRYPAPQPSGLNAQMAEYYGADQQNLLISRGADEAIDLITRCFCEAGRDSIAISPPTYGMYEVSAAIQGCEVERVPLRRTGALGFDFELDVEALIALSRARAGQLKLIYICSPNNPTGGSFQVHKIEHLCREVAQTSLVVVDEAYAEFASESGFYALARAAMGDVFSRLPNLIVLRTLSKAWGLAGLRVGCAIAHAETIRVMQKIRAPYPLVRPSIELAGEAFSGDGVARMRARARSIVSARATLAEKLSKTSAVDLVVSSDANFILVKFHDASRVLREARARRIALRDRSQEPGLAGCVRITVGSSAENDLVLEAVLAAGAIT